MLRGSLPWLRQQRCSSPFHSSQRCVSRSTLSTQLQSCIHSSWNRCARAGCVICAQDRLIWSKFRRDGFVLGVFPSTFPLNRSSAAAGTLVNQWFLVACFGEEEEDTLWLRVGDALRLLLLLALLDCCFLPPGVSMAPVARVEEVAPRAPEVLSGDRPNASLVATCRSPIQCWLSASGGATSSRASCRVTEPVSKGLDRRAASRNNRACFS